MKTIIAIGRQFGSGGREIGEKLSKEFNIPFYDKELLSRAAKESGFCEELFQTHDERPTNSFLYNFIFPKLIVTKYGSYAVIVPFPLFLCAICTMSMARGHPKKIKIFSKIP